MTMTIEAPAKLNLTLDVTGRRPDGYHEMHSIMQTVNLADIVRMTANREGRIHLQVSDPSLPADGRNTAYKAASLFFSHTGWTRTGIDIAVEKHILPIEELCQLGAGVGADVPFCVLGGTAEATGTGTDLRTLPPLPDCTVLVVKPPVGVSTAQAYGLVDGAAITRRPDTAAMTAALSAGDLAAVGGLLGNVFEEAMALPEVAEIREIVAGFPAAGCIMTGSGSAVFALFERGEDAAACAARLRPRFPENWLCRPCRTGARCL